MYFYNCFLILTFSKNAIETSSVKEYYFWSLFRRCRSFVISEEDMISSYLLGLCISKTSFNRKE